MKTNSLQQTITETLELCLSKMSKKLKTDFDPENKNSLRLLQQFRSTLTTLRSWIKQANNFVNQTIDSVKNTVSKNNDKPSKYDASNVIPETPLSKEHQRLMTLINQPNKLKCLPDMW